MLAQRTGRRLGFIAAAAVVLLLTGAVGVGASQMAAGERFIDDDGNLHEADIETIAAEGITRGCNPAGSRYCPTDAVTRGQMAAFLNRALNPPAGGPIPFVDVDDSQFAVDIAAMHDAGITLGCTASGDRFCPEDVVSRGQMAAFLARALDLPAGDTTPFTDVADSQFSGDIAAVYAAGITLGTSSTTFSPGAPITRAQMASFLVRALGL